MKKHKRLMQALAAAAKPRKLTPEELLPEYVRLALQNPREVNFAPGCGLRAAKYFAEHGVRILGIVRMRTHFIQWEVGGTYRHYRKILCNPTLAKSVWADQPRCWRGPQGGATIREIFGSSSQSASGLYFLEDGVVVYEDQ